MSMSNWEGRSSEQQALMPLGAKKALICWARDGQVVSEYTDA
ncbi:hypothetical protein [Leptolyngbya sp. FACHB-261]|nr:hypothetical protein [Leptolyngbya sp. FACHB-261]